MRPRCSNIVRAAVLVGAAALAMTAGHPAARGEDADRGVVTKSRDGLSFTLPPDWPVERRGGLVNPIPVEEYLAMKFKKLESQLQLIEQRLNGLDVRVRIIEQGLQQPAAQGLRSSEAP